MPEKALLGRSSEQIAVKYLEKKGYRIIRRNFRLKKAEIDIIAEDGPCLVFIEVKARSSGLFGAPEEAVDMKKQQKITEAALGYMALEKTVRAARFDVIAIGPAGLTHIKDAFEMKD